MMHCFDFVKTFLNFKTLFQLIFRNLPFGMMFVDFVPDTGGFFEKMAVDMFRDIFDTADSNGS